MGLLDTGFLDDFRAKLAPGGGLVADPLFRLGLGILSAGGPQSKPHSVGQDIASGFASLQQQQDADANRQYQSMQMQQMKDLMDWQKKARTWMDKYMPWNAQGPQAAAGPAPSTAAGPGDVPDSGNVPSDLFGQPFPAAPTPEPVRPPPTPAGPVQGLSPTVAPQAPQFSSGPSFSAGGNVGDNTGLSGHYDQGVMNIESYGGQDVPASARHSARGYFQFMPETYAQYAAAAGVDPNDWSKEAQFKVHEAYKKANVGRLQLEGLPVNDTNAYALHLIGEGGGGQRFLKALARDPSTPVSAAVSGSTISNNPGIFRGARTVADAYRNMQRKMAGDGKGQVVAPTGTGFAPSAPSAVAPTVDATLRAQAAQPQGPQAAVSTTPPTAAPAAAPAADAFPELKPMSDVTGIPTKDLQRMLFAAMAESMATGDVMTPLGKMIQQYKDERDTYSTTPLHWIDQRDGSEHYSVMNKAGEWKEIFPPGELVGRGQPRPEGDLSNPDYRKTVEATATYVERLPSANNSQMSRYREKLRNDANDFRTARGWKPYDESMYDVIKGNRVAWTKGTQGQQLMATNTAANHALLAMEAIDKLQNSDFKDFNTMANWLKTRMGWSDAPTTFQQIAQRLSAELNKSIVANGGTAQERALGELDPTLSGDILKRNLGATLQLLGGRLASNRAFYQASLGPYDDIREFLSPGVQQIMEEGTRASQISPGQVHEMMNQPSIEESRPQPLPENRADIQPGTYTLPNGMTVTIKPAPPSKNEMVKGETYLMPDGQIITY